MRSLIGKILYAAVLPALVVGGIAIAQGGGNSSSTQKGKSAGKSSHWKARGGPPHGGPFGGDLTYAEFHSQRNGKEVVTRLDRGKIKSVDSSSITITENNGSDVTIPLDDSTRVFTPDKGPDAKVSDLKEGQQVNVEREEGQPARVVMVAPRNGDRPPGPPAFRHRRGNGGPPAWGPPPSSPGQPPQSQQG